MEQLIRLLPDHIANQIAAGEVVQRPASVVKELLENSVDAGATDINLVLKDAGKTLIQVIDNGSGMGELDARLCFERHATSKIRKAEDLFQIRTMGFRGEAMASIAAVAQVTMRTRLHDAELGIEVVVEGSEFRKVEPVVTPAGTTFLVKNLFYNIPARRKILKSNPVETRHLMAEFIRVALAHPQISMRMEHNGTSVFTLAGTSLEKRVGQLFGEDIAGQIVGVGEETSYAAIRGFVGTPDAARKARGEQFFFVNKRFIRSAYMHHAVMTAYKDLLKEETYPFYCIFISIDPSHVDVNIHPTKTEIKFDDERTIYSLLHSVIRKGLGQLHNAPELDFSDTRVKDIISSTPSQGEEMTIKNFRSHHAQVERPSVKGWEELFSSPDDKGENGEPGKREEKYPVRSPDEINRLFNREEEESLLVQVRGRFILTMNRGALLLVDQHLAHERILYERFLNARQQPPLPGQQLLFPRSLTFSVSDMEIVKELEPQFHHLGFDLKPFGRDRFLLHSLPAGVSETAADAIFDEVIAECRETGSAKAGEKLFTRLAMAIARRGAVPHGRKLSLPEMKSLIEDLFSCEQPSASPGGKPVFYALDFVTLQNYFSK